MPGILVFGDINIDLLAHYGAEPAWGLDNLVGELVQECGGVGANVAVALAQWGITARLAGAVGTDAFGERALNFLATRNVDLKLVKRTSRAPTGLIFIAVRPGGQRTIFGSRGANAEFHLDRDAISFDDVAGVHLVGYNFLSPGGEEAAEFLIQEAHRRGAWVSLDPGMAPCQYMPEKIAQVAERVDYFIVGLSEALALYGHEELSSALAMMKACHTCGPKEVVVKRGEKGSLIYEAGSWREVPPFAVESRDTTGSGDAFAAAYLCARMNGWPHTEAALVGNAAGAAAAITPGASESMPEPHQVLKLVASSTLAAPWEAVRQRVQERLKAEYGRTEGKASGS